MIYLRKYEELLSASKVHRRNLERNKILQKNLFFTVSAIFPVVQNEFYTSSLHFLGYWLLKRNISEVTFVLTLRNSTGQILLRKTEIIDSAKAFSVNLHSLLAEINPEVKKFHRFNRN